MYKILLVDDEILVRDAIRENIDWKSLDCELVGDCENGRQAVEFVQKLRKADMRKSPSISETLDWANALVALNASNLDKDVLEDTLSVLLKHEADLQKAKRQLIAPPPQQRPRNNNDEFGRFSGN